MLKNKSVDATLQQTKQVKKGSEKIIAARDAIRHYLKKPKKELGFFSKQFDPHSGLIRAETYLALLTHGDLDAKDKLLVLYSLLTHTGKELRLIVSLSLGFNNHKEAAQNIEKEICALINKDGWKPTIEKLIKPLQKAINEKQPIDELVAKFKMCSPRVGKSG